MNFSKFWSSKRNIFLQPKKKKTELYDIVVDYLFLYSYWWDNLFLYIISFHYGIDP